MFGVKLGVLLLALTSVAVLPAGTAVNDHWYESVCVSVTGLGTLQLVVPSVSVVTASRPMANPGATLLLVALPSVTVPVPVVTVCVADVEGWGHRDGLAEEMPLGGGRAATRRQGDAGRERGLAEGPAQVLRLGEREGVGHRGVGAARAGCGGERGRRAGRCRRRGEEIL